MAARVLLGYFRSFLTVLHFSDLLDKAGVSPLLCACGIFHLFCRPAGVDLSY